MNTTDIINLIKNKNFVVYGNGFIAKRFLRRVETLGYSSHVSAIAVTNVSESNKDENVIPIAEVERDSLIFIAAHDETAKEMEYTARNLGFMNIINIYYYLFDLEIGEPIQRGVFVKIDKIIKNLKGGCYPAIYYLSILDYLGENKYNGSIYMRAYSHFSTLESSQKRWLRFKKKIDEFEKNGFYQDYNVKITRDYCLFDGLHRLTLAKYYGIDELSCDMYDCSYDFYTNCMFDGYKVLEKGYFDKYFSTSEIADIEKSARLLGLNKC